MFKLLEFHTKILLCSHICSMDLIINCKTVTEDEVTNQEYEMVSSDLASIVDIAILMKQPLRDVDYLDDLSSLLCGTFN